CSVAPRAWPRRAPGPWIGLAAGVGLAAWPVRLAVRKAVLAVPRLLPLLAWIGRVARRHARLTGKLLAGKLLAGELLAGGLLARRRAEAGSAGEPRLRRTRPVRERRAVGAGVGMVEPGRAVPLGRVARRARPGAAVGAAVAGKAARPRERSWSRR